MKIRTTTNNGALRWANTGTSDVQGSDHVCENQHKGSNDG
jgi:hypothetical protein